MDSISWTIGSGYPGHLAEITKGRAKKKLGDAAGLDQFGVNLTRIQPGYGSALRHWHENEDEFIYVLQGELVLIEEQGETTLKAGDAAGFKSGVANGHQLVNRSQEDALCLEVGTRAAVETGHYPDDDLLAVKTDTGFVFTRKDGSPYDR